MPARLFERLRGARERRWNAARPYLVGVLIAAIVIVAAAVASTTQFGGARAASLPARDLTNGARAVHVRGFDLWYREVGPVNPAAAKGRPVIVVIHGGPGMSDHYFNDSLDFLADRYRVVYYDQRGSGFSQIRPNPSLYRFSNLAGDLDALRRRVIHADKLLLVAHSFGGPVAMSYAARYPSHVAGFILVSSMPARDYTQKPKGSPPFDDWFSHQPATVADHELLRSYMSDISDTLYDPSDGIAPDIGYLSYLPSRMLWYTAIGYDFAGALSRMRVPSLIIYGSADTLLPSVPQSLHSLLSGSQLVRFNASGHWAFLEEPGRFRSVVGAFVAKSFP